jgi:hypothetical protein
MHLIIYLDFDGVLHADEAYRTPRGIELRCAGTLFEHAGILIDALAPYPDARIILSTSWVRELGFNRAKEYLPDDLARLVIGATYHTKIERDEEFTSNMRWTTMTRYEQIYSHAVRHQIGHWFAIDDDHAEWPDVQSDQLVATNGKLGLNDFFAKQQLNKLLAEHHEAELIKHLMEPK